MRALITGITGFVGAHLLEYLVAQGDQVVGVSQAGCWPARLEHFAALGRVERLDLADAHLQNTRKISEQRLLPKPDASQAPKTEYVPCIRRVDATPSRN